MVDEGRECGEDPPCPDGCDCEAMDKSSMDPCGELAAALAVEGERREDGNAEEGGEEEE